jgi:hypothetical protein
LREGEMLAEAGGKLVGRVEVAMVANGQRAPVKAPNATRVVAPRDATGPGKFGRAERRRAVGTECGAAGGETTREDSAAMGLDKKCQLGPDQIAG